VRRGKKKRGRTNSEKWSGKKGQGQFFPQRKASAKSKNGGTGDVLIDVRQSGKSGKTRGLTDSKNHSNRRKSAFDFIVLERNIPDGQTISSGGQSTNGIHDRIGTQSDCITIKRKTKDES